MGVSSNGILVYGINFDEEPPEFIEAFDNDFDDYLNSLSGLPEYGQPGHDFAAQRAFRETVPADMTMYCSYEYPMYILAVRGTETVVHRGYVKDIESLEVPADRVEAFKAWCIDRGIQNPEPKWLLCSMYG